MNIVQLVRIILYSGQSQQGLRIVNYRVRPWMGPKCCVVLLLLGYSCHFKFIIVMLQTW